MDQDSFRRMMQTPRAGGSLTLGVASGSRPKLAIPIKQKQAEPAEPAFKPRKIKKPSDSRYRDRAAERRVGEGNDYAQVEAVLEDFEKRHAEEDKDKVEAQRKYLGGDSEHSILVKGLDFALLEQNKAKSVLSKDDVDDLEAAFHEAHSNPKPSLPKKRTREEIVQELKQRRSQKGDGGQAAAASEGDTLQKGKFKPIGFKPIGASSPGKKKKAPSESTDGDKRKKKKRKVEQDAGGTTNVDGSMPPPPVPAPKIASKISEPEESVGDDFDIFADAGDYQGVDVDDDEDEEGAGADPPKSKKDESLEEGEQPSTVLRRWIDTDDDPVLSRPSRPEPKASSFSPSGRGLDEEDDDMEDDRPPTRLAPLESSALPSIKDLLAMDKAAGSYDKKKKRRDKKKAGGGEDDDDAGDDASKKKTLEDKVDRDYKRLKTYTDKKAAAEGK